MIETKNEKIIRIIFKLISYITIIISGCIILSLIIGVIPFFKEYPITQFYNLSVPWNPGEEQFGIFPLVIGTLKVVLIAIIISVPLGLFTAIYLSEYASKRVKKYLKPILEILAGIPSIIYGIFAYQVINPLVSTNAYSSPGAAIAMSFMLVPMISSLSEDVLSSIPNNIREASLGIGSTKQEMITKILIPAGLSGIMASVILAFSRALGETMIVAIAAGSGANDSLNIFEGGLTMTGAMMQSVGTDASWASLEYTSLYAIGITLFLVVLVLNIFSRAIINKFKINYN